MGILSQLANCKVKGLLGQFVTNKTVAIQDWRLGLLYWFGKFCVAVYVIGTIAQSGSYAWSEKPDGSPTFWFESGNLYKAQNKSAAYCNNEVYNYHFSNDVNSYWNELDISCRSMHYGEITLKSAAEGFVTTYFKEEKAKVARCLPTNDACATLLVPKGGRTSRNSHTTDHGFLAPTTSVCTCGKLGDAFVHGAEEIELHIEHSFWATQKMDIAGSSTYSEGGHFKGEEEDKRKLIKTCLKKKGAKDDECFMEFEPGEPMSLRMSDWLSLAGISLDERLEHTVTKDKVTGEYPHRRITGVTLILHFKYYGDATNEVFRCDVEVDKKDAWTSIGSAVQYISYKDHRDFEMYDRYRRGIQIQFFTEGQITKFDWNTFFYTIIAGLVLLGFVDTFVAIICVTLLSESPAYKKAKSEPFNHAKALATFSVHSAMACQAFKVWDTDKDGRISIQELKDVFSSFFDPAESNRLADTIAKEAYVHGDESEGLSVTLQDFIHIISSESVSMEELRAFKEKEEQEDGDTSKFGWVVPYKAA